MAKPNRDKLDLRQSLRGIWLIMGTAYRSAPWLAVGAFVLVPLSQMEGQLLAVWMKLLADGVYAHDVTKATWAALLMAVSAGLTIIVMLGGGKLRLTLTERAGFELDRRLAQLVAELPGLEHHERPEYLDRLELLRQQRGLLGQVVNALVSNLAVIAQLLFTVVLLVRLSPWLLLLLLAGVPGMLLVPRQQARSRLVEDETAPLDRLGGSLFTLATTAAPGKELRVFNVEDEIVERHQAAWWKAYRLRRRLVVRNAIESTVIYAIPTLGIVGAVAFVATRAARGVNTPGDVLLAATLAGQAVGLLAGTIGIFTWMLQTLRSVTRFLWLIDYSDEAHAAAREPASPPDNIADGIVFHQVSFRYPGTETDVLTDVDLRLPAGSVVAFVGENGAGKTTLVKLLCRFYEPTTGRITVDGTDIRSIAHDKWRQHLAAGFQDFTRFELLVGQTVGIGNLPLVDDEPAVRAALARAGAADLPAELDGGLAGQLGRQWEDGIELSGGQWQKLALGRALMREEPLLLVLDEPTSALDAETEHALFERFADASRSTANGGITVLVSHRFSTVRMADLIVVVDDGRIREVGSHAELMATPDLYAELYQMQARSYR